MLNKKCNKGLMHQREFLGTPDISSRIYRVFIRSCVFVNNAQKNIELLSQECSREFVSLHQGNRQIPKYPGIFLHVHLATPSLISRQCEGTNKNYALQICKMACRRPNRLKGNIYRYFSFINTDRRERN